MYKVIKKDGSEQDFDKMKISSGVQKSGATPEIAEAVASEVEMWLPEKVMDGKISYMDLKTKVMDVLRSKDSTAADAFMAFTK